MSRVASLVVLSVGILFGVPAAAGELEELARRAVSTDAATAENAIRALRAQGPRGLQALVSVHAAAIETHNGAIAGRIGILAMVTDDDAAETGGEWQRLSHALDVVGAQRDNHAARLFWYTDLAAAMVAAKDARKPVLSLRLLGNLTDDLSCANSRFFRATLYANGEIAAFLRDEFVLHWQQVRPVPKVTIDFGDGRRIERTLTGNSIHYILDSDGRPVDALPGLYGPRAFLRHLVAARDCADAMMHAPESERGAVLRAWHAAHRGYALAAWRADLARFATIDENTRDEDLGRLTTEDIWQAIARSHSDDAQLDDRTLLLIAEHQPSATKAAGLAISKLAVEDPLLRLTRNLEGTIALDSVRNEYQFHTRIHEWFAADDPSTCAIVDLNWRVYEELFLMPESDPWLGLAQPDVYTGISGSGIRTE